MDNNDGIKIMERRAADNKYLHKDFHQSMNILLIYILEYYGKEKLIEYLREYGRSYHKPLHDKLAAGDLSALFEYLKDIYEKEEWPVTINYDPEKEEIIFRQEACPAIAQIRSMGAQPCNFYNETYNTVYSAICENTPFKYELISFNDETGECEQIFRKI